MAGGGDGRLYNEREARGSAGTNFQTCAQDHLRPAVLKVWSADSWWSLRPFQGVCEFKTICIVILRHLILRWG